MPRCARRKSENQIYHVMMRGNNREKVFINEEDKFRIMDILREKKQAQEYHLYAYCVMDNHLHLVLKEGQDHLSRIVKRIAVSYSNYFNKKYKRIGHVFQERFKSEIIDDENYLLAAIRYIHQNPLKAGNGNVTGYKWSSYNDYMSKGKNISDTEEILSLFASSKSRALSEFKDFHNVITQDTFLDVAEEKEINVENAVAYINEYLFERTLDVNDLKSISNRAVRADLVRTLLEKSDLSRRQIASLLELNREMVRKIALS